MEQLIGILLLVIGVVMFFVLLGAYNGLVRLRNQLERAWANIDVILKQRSDEIPHLVEVASQYANYESGLLQKLADARSQYGGARSVEDKMRASNELSQALSGFLAIGEAYPELKSNQTILDLQNRISDLENTLADRRELYNETVANFNTRLEQFPDVIAARILNYRRQTHFQIADTEREKPSVKLNLPKFS